MTTFGVTIEMTSEDPRPKVTIFCRTCPTETSRIGATYGFVLSDQIMSNHFEKYHDPRPAHTIPGISG